MNFEGAECVGEISGNLFVILRGYCSRGTPGGLLVKKSSLKRQTTGFSFFSFSDGPEQEFGQVCEGIWTGLAISLSSLD